MPGIIGDAKSVDTFTADLHAAAKWLKVCGIDSIAMESTGVYWIPVFQILESYGFEVVLVRDSENTNVPELRLDLGQIWPDRLSKTADAVVLHRGFYD